MRVFLALICVTLLAGSIPSAAGEAPPPQHDMVLWYRQPATQWQQAMLMGNGLIGAAAFGGTSHERIALNESSFWSGRPHDYALPDCTMRHSVLDVPHKWSVAGRAAGFTVSSFLAPVP